MNEDYEKIDIKDARERLQIDEISIKKLITMFLDSDMLEKAEEAFTKANVDEAKMAIHSIKGTAANVGIVGLSDLASKIELKIKENEYLDFELLSMMKEIWQKLKSKMNN